MPKTPANRNLFLSVKALIEQAQAHVVRNINTTMLLTYFEIGRMIVEDELKGKGRADYAEQTIMQLSMYLTKEFGRGFSKSNLEYMRQFYRTYQGRIIQSPIGQSEKKLANSKKSRIPQSLIGQSQLPFTLSWTHYTQLLKVDDENERNFYEIEASQNNWSVRELSRQYNASLFERVALSRDKKSVKSLAQKGQIVEKPLDVLKSHYVLEFLNLKEDNSYTESDLESAIH